MNLLSARDALSAKDTQKGLSAQEPAPASAESLQIPAGHAASRLPSTKEPVRLQDPAHAPKTHLESATAQHVQKGEPTSRNMSRPKSPTTPALRTAGVDAQAQPATQHAADVAGQVGRRIDQHGSTSRSPRVQQVAQGSGQGSQGVELAAVNHGPVTQPAQSSRTKAASASTSLHVSAAKVPTWTGIPSLASQPQTATQAGQPSAPPATLQPFHSAAEFADALGQHVLFMVGHSRQDALINLSPPHLGSVQIHLRTEQQAVNAMFVSPHADVRQALEAAMPGLRQALSQQGLSLSGGFVADHGQQGASGHGSSQFSRPKTPAWSMSRASQGSSNSSTIAASLHSVARGVSIYA